MSNKFTRGFEFCKFFKEKVKGFGSTKSKYEVVRPVEVEGCPMTDVGSGQWAVGSGQWAVGSGQWAVGSGQWAVGSFVSVLASCYLILKSCFLRLAT
ncbi:MAG: hypothetical protein Q8K16_00075 [Algoriphagus sp.]|nr:hypothetical protein [Algoriphagus sp.]MDP2039546.1 hypothetical protein [Algoriphagus sp.]